MKKWNYYNDTDPKICAWAKELIKAKLVPDGEVDCRSIEDVRPDEIKDFIQCHFFCGILGWSLALRLCGWPDDQPVWTGSCPCQPFSAAGKGKGIADERHLWPAFKWLIQQCQPPVVFGEQVASKDGRHWLAGVRADLEDLGFTVGAADLCAAGVGAPHIRQRLYWMAHATLPTGARLGQFSQHIPRQAVCGVVQSDSAGWEPGKPTTKAAGYGRAIEPAGRASRLGDSNLSGCIQQRSTSPIAQESFAAELLGCAWEGFNTIQFTDGKTRRIESSISPLAHGIPGRVGLLRGYGNAIVPQAAAAFILASVEALNATP
jgi:DNA (cytosine-5)-methyltransferase 1